MPPPGSPLRASPGREPFRVPAPTLPAMTAPDPLPGTAVTTHRASLAAVNARDLEAAAALVDPVRHRENCVGSTRGSVGRASGLAGLGALPWRSVDRPGHGAARASVGGSRAARTAG